MAEISTIRALQDGLGVLYNIATSHNPDIPLLARITAAEALCNLAMKCEEGPFYSLLIPIHDPG